MLEQEKSDDKQNKTRTPVIVVVERLVVLITCSSYLYRVNFELTTKRQVLIIVSKLRLLQWDEFRNEATVRRDNRRAHFFFFLLEPPSIFFSGGKICPKCKWVNGLIGFVCEVRAPVQRESTTLLRLINTAELKINFKIEKKILDGFNFNKVCWRTRRADSNN